MKRGLLILAFAAATLGLVGAVLGTDSGPAAQTSQAVVPSYEVVFNLPVGAAGVHYEGLLDEQRPWGPSALHRADDGTFWIADSVANRLVQFSEEGEFVRVVKLPGELVSAADFELTDSGFTVLDTSSQQPAVFQLSGSGTVLGKQLLPVQAASSVTGLSASPSGEVLLEEEGGSRFSRVQGASGRTADLVPTDALAEKDLRVDALPVENAFHVSWSGTGTTAMLDYTLAKAVPVRTLGDGRLFVLVEEMTVTDSILVDQTVWQYDRNLNLLGKARIPLSEQYAYVDHPLAITDEGEVFALLTTKDGAAVIRLIFQPELVPILRPGTAVESPQPSNAAASCVSRTTMISRASGYLNNSRSLTSTNISGSCTGRGKPRYLSTPGTYTSVSYDWGGEDSVAAFNAAMGASSNNKAGDINTSSSESCSRGVDCSGFVTRIWGLTPKHSTWTLPNVSTLLSSTSQLLRGDIVNKAGDHTALFSSSTSTGAYWYESTIAGSVDRVVYKSRSWSYFSGYQPRRYHNVC